MFINIECEISKTIREKRASLGIAEKQAFDRRNWLPNIRRYERMRAEKFHRMALTGELFPS